MARTTSMAGTTSMDSGPRRGAAPRDDRGAIVPMVAVLMTLLVALAAFAVDLGQLRVGRGDMQALADVVSLDLARQIDGRTAQVILADPTWVSARSQSIQRNGSTFGSAPVVQAELGTYDPFLGFSVVTGTAVPNAVRVNAQTTVDFAFRPGSGDVARSSVAQTDAAACFGVGSFAARIRGDNKLTGSLSTSVNTPLLTTTINLLTQVNSGYALTAGGYTGLLDATLSLAELATQLGVGSPDRLAGTTTTLSGFYLAAAQVLEHNGNTADAQALQTLSQNLTSAGNVRIGDLLAASQGSGTDATLNVFDLVTASALAVNGANVLSVPGVGVSAGSLANVQLKLSLIQKPQTACSRANDAMVVASTAQLSTTATAQFASPQTATLAVGTAVGGLLGTVGAVINASVAIGPQASSGVSATLAVAPATARLTAVTCATPDKPVQTLTLATQSGVLRSTATVPLALRVTVLGLNATVNVVYTVTSSAAEHAATTTLTIPPQSFDTLYPSTGATPFRLTTTTVTYTTSIAAGSAPIPGLDLDLIATNAGNVVLPGIVNQLNDQLVSPLTGLLGPEVGGADVFASSSLRPTCNVPRLSL